MNKIKEAAEAFSHLTRFQYDFTIGRKGVKREFRLDFDKADFHHLCGLHKLRDIPILQQGMRSVIFDKILAGELDDAEPEDYNFVRDYISKYIPKDARTN